MSVDVGAEEGYVQIILESGHVVDVSRAQWAMLRTEITGEREWLAVEDRYGAECTIRRVSIAAARETSPAIEAAFEAAHPDGDEGWG